MSKPKKLVKKVKNAVSSSGSGSGLGSGIGIGSKDYGRGRPEAGDASQSIISLRFQDLALRHSDVRLLQGPYQLNERILSFYYTYLQTRRYKMKPELHFLAPTLSRSLRLLELRERNRLVRELQLSNKLFVFVPLYESAHWSLLLISRPDRKFYYFDSEDERHLILARLLYELLKICLVADDFEFTVSRCLQQSKGQDTESGVHLMCMTDNLADYVCRVGYATSTLLVSYQEVLGMRSTQLQLIRTLGGNLPQVK